MGRMYVFHRVLICFSVAFCFVPIGRSVDVVVVVMVFFVVAAGFLGGFDEID